MISSAVFSTNRVYRYELWRIWGDKTDYCMFIGLNPSTADETKDDPTVRRCIAFAKDWGYGALCMTNLFAFRATDPRQMMQAKSPVGLKNNETLVKRALRAGKVVAAWGKNGKHLSRNHYVVSMLVDSAVIYCLGCNDDSSPKHPLYLPKLTKLEPYCI